MVLLATMGTSAEAPEQVKEPVYYDPETDIIVNWSGMLNQPAIHAPSRSNFNAADVFNRLAVGPGSVSAAINTKSADTWLFLVCAAVVVTYCLQRKNWPDQQRYDLWEVRAAHYQGVHRVLKE
jgi:hypothetical protein